MSETPVKVVVDLSKPQGERQQIVPLTAEEIAELEAAAVEAEQNRLAREAEEAARVAAKESALAKLAALGLTEAEAQAIVGA